MINIAVAMVGLFAFFIIRTYVWQFNAKLNGLDAEAYVSWIEHVVRYAAGAEYPMTYYYVRFRRYDDLEAEARLMNPNKSLKMGSHVRIRYVPGREEIATLMELE